MEHWKPAGGLFASILAKTEDQTPARSAQLLQGQRPEPVSHKTTHKKELETV